MLFIDPMGDNESTGLNMGIAYCATSVMGHGHTVSVLDLVNVREGNASRRIHNAVSAFRPDAIGISVTNMSFSNVKTYITGLRRYFDGFVILGGPEISALRGKSLTLLPGADIAVIGEGEETLVELLEALEECRELSNIKGIAWCDEHGIKTTARREFIRDLDTVSLPDYHIFGVDKIDVYSLISTRGCPYGCAFCFSHLGKHWRARSALNIIEEIKKAKYRYGAKMFHICDASFNVDIDRVILFCRLLIENKLDMPWVIQGFRADRMTEEMMRWLKKANCKRIWVGIETLEDDVFQKINKGETLQQIKQGIALMKKYNIEIFGYMLMGLPGDTFKKTLRSFEKARGLGLDLLAYSSCVPFTGTRIERWAKDNATVFTDSYNISSIGTQYDNIAFETKDFTKEERAKARKILNIRSGSYNEPAINPVLFKFKKWFLIVRYDIRHLGSRLRQSIQYRRQYKTSVDSINLKRGIYFAKLPDGTWGLKKDERLAPESRKRFFLDLKRVTMSEVEV